MNTMRAIALKSPGGEKSPVLSTVPVPAIEDTEVLVRVRAVGVGLHDRWFIPSGANFPYPIGIEAAGIVQRVGSSVRGRHVGDRVMFTNSRQPKGGTWAEFTAVPEGSLIDVPHELGFVDAAALPVAGGTALESMRSLDLNRADTLFIAGASGAIGTLAIQLAVAAGVRVAASASSSNQQYLRSLGAEHAVDYRDPAWAARVRQWAPDGVDAALAIQPGTAAPSLPVIKDGGRLVTVSGDHVTPERHITVEQIGHHAETAPALSALAVDAAAGRIRVVVERTYPLDRGVAALEKTETRHARGKVVLTLD